ncbi:MAG TPA: chorismate-binding protein [Microbacteriaceae bacterium]|nr:chorismate-binding protein [Microbacteriaceae bacterium]
MQITLDELVIKIRTASRAFGNQCAWFCLDGGGFGDPQKSYLGFTTRLIECQTGNEEEFKKRLTQLWENELNQESRVSESEPKHFFHGGWVLALAYEFGRSHSNDINSEELTALALHVPAVIEFDEQKQVLRVLNAYDKNFVYEYDFEVPALTDTLENIVAEIKADQSAENENKSINPVNKDNVANGDCKANLSSYRMNKKTYIKTIDKAKKIINETSASVLCLTNQITLQNASDYDVVSTFLNLKRLGGAPRSGLIEWGNKWIMSASPERFLSKKGMKISSSPIKGTRPRGETFAEDESLKLELLQSPKEIAENARVLDAVAAELFQLAEVPDSNLKFSGSLESYKQVHQLVSHVATTVSQKTTFWQIIDAIFPAASMTGVPKEAAIKHLRNLEEANRGWYSGCFGTISPGAVNIEMAMTIRSIESNGSEIRIGAGGGITEASEPHAEWKEMEHKASAMLKALQTLN